MNEITIKEIWLFTNRTVAVFDENGEQIADIQKILSFESLKSWNDAMTEQALEKVVKDKPAIYITQWGKWKNSITMDEFCCLLGHGEWYWNTRRTETGSVE